MATSLSLQTAQPCSLTDVPETMLWTLHNRAYEAKRSDGCLYDDKCLSIYRSIDYDYVKSFGKADGSHGVRSMLFDQQIKRFLRKHHDAVIVNLGEGLETQQFRITFPESVLWLSVDVPDAIALRERFIQPDSQHRHIAKSVLDTRWFDEVPEGRPIFITAQGLFMYFEEKQLESLFQAMAQRFEGAILMFDYLNVYLSQRTMSDKGWMKTPYYRTPPMPWGINRDDLEPTLSRWIGYRVDVHHLPFLFPRGLRHYLVPLLERIPFIYNRLPGVCWLKLKPS